MTDQVDHLTSIERNLRVLRYMLAVQLVLTLVTVVVTWMISERVSTHQSGESPSGYGRHASMRGTHVEHDR
jgi:hypothetical protein